MKSVDNKNNLIFNNLLTNDPILHELTKILLTSQALIMTHLSFY